MRQEDIIYDHLLGKPFVQGVNDCYSILRSVLKDNFDIRLSNYARPDDFWIQGMNLYEENFKKEKFISVTDISLIDIKIMDVMLVAIPDARLPSVVVTNHCAIYVGDGQVIHHPYQRFSTKSPYRGALKNFTVKILRHPDLPDIVEPSAKADIINYILPQKRSMILDAKSRHKNSLS